MHGQIFDKFETIFLKFQCGFRKVTKKQQIKEKDTVDYFFFKKEKSNIWYLRFVSALADCLKPICIAWDLFSTRGCYHFIVVISYHHNGIVETYAIRKWFTVKHITLLAWLVKHSWFIGTSMCNRTSFAQVHELLRKYYIHLASLGFEHSLCHGSPMTTYKNIYTIIRRVFQVDFN